MSEDLQLAGEAVGMFHDGYQSIYIDSLLERLEAMDTSPERRTILLDVLSSNHSELPRIVAVLESLYHASEDDQKHEILVLLGQYGDDATPALPFLSENLATESTQTKLALIDTMQRILAGQRSSRRRSSDVDDMVSAYMQRYDNNRDGVLNPGEWDRISRMIGPDGDRDRDGILRPEELRQALRSRLRSSSRSRSQSPLQTPGRSSRRSPQRER